MAWTPWPILSIQCRRAIPTSTTPGKPRRPRRAHPWRICFKDVGGLLTPDRARTLIPVVLKAAGDIPVEFHAHCNSGQAPLNYLEGVKLGMRILHTAIPPLANGSSQPSIFNIASNLKALGYDPQIDLKPLEPVVKHFTAVAQRDGCRSASRWNTTRRMYRHQVPGGMISNMRHQLKIVGKEHLMEAALEEAGQVRKDFGYPIMVTPLSQFVGTQAAINVIVGERYKEVPDQNIQYALGIWGKEAVEVMDPNVRDKILSRPRAKEWTHWEQPEPTLHEIRQKYGVQLSDEDLDFALLRRRRVRQSAAQPRQTERISRRHPAAGKNHRAASEAQRFESSLHQAAGISRCEWKNARRLARRISDF